MAAMNGVETVRGTAGANEDSTSFTRDSGALRRRMNRFRRAGMLDNPATVTVEQATTVEDLCQAYALVHDVFVFQNYITPQPGGMRIRPYEALPEMATFVAKAEGRVVAVMGVVPDTEEFGLPSDKAFGEELNMLRRQGRRVVETTNLAVAPEYRSSGVFFELTRACVAHALNQGYDDSFISISPGHSTFFQAVLGFEPWGDRRDYGSGKGEVVDYVEGMRIDLRRFHLRVRELDALLGPEAFLHNWFFLNNPHFETTTWSAAAARQKFLELPVLRELFVDRTGYLGRCDDEVIGQLARIWGRDRMTALQAGFAASAAQTPTAVAA